MYRVLDCLNSQHDYRLVALAAFICLAAAFSAFWLYPAALSRTGARRWRLVALAGVCTAAGIWTTHFVAMLAYDAGLPVSYDLPLTIASLLTAVVMTTFGFGLMTGGRTLDNVFGGAVIGFGIAGMHFLGMESVIIPGRLSWDNSLVAASIAIGVALSSAATLAHARLPGRWSSLGAPLFLTLAICSLHFTAMGAATFTPDPTISAIAMEIDALTLAIVIAGVAALITLVGLFASLLDRINISRGTVGFGATVVATLAGTIAISGYAVEQLKIGGPNYNRIIEGKDLVADILPPPVYIIEAYLEARLAVDDPDGILNRKQRLQILHKGYQERVAHWSASPSIPKEIKELLLVDSHRQVSYFWHEIDHAFIPALERRNPAEIAISFDRLTANYLGHRLFVDQLTERANNFASFEEHTATARGGMVKWMVVASVLVLLLVIGGAIIALRRLVVGPVLKLAEYLQTLAGGRYDATAPFATRGDEVGAMASAIEKLRFASLEKQRLEAEAVVARQRRDEARVLREREKAAEAMRLNMANESITSLNDELNETIAQLKRAQDESVRKGKLAQLGQLTATVAHEIRNPLGSIKTAVFLIDRKTQGKGLALEAAMKRLHNGVHRCDNIITELLDFTRTKVLKLTSQSVDDWVQSVLDDERRSLPAKVEFTTDFGIGPAHVQFDDSRMRRVLINLLSNASEAMVGKEGEQLEAPTANPRIDIATRIQDGNIEIVVTDNGPGISEENLARIREPLFTTKSFGVGLGLPAVENILEVHGGGLTIVSKVGAGTTMTAWFPAKLGALEPGTTQDLQVA